MSVNPLNSYIKGNDGPLSNDSLVVDKVYAVNGVINTVGVQKANYQDPNSNQSNIAVPIVLPPVNKKTTWSSAQTLNDTTNTTYSFQFTFSQITYVNQIEFDITSVPVQWTLYQGSNAVDSALITTGIISQYDTNGTIHVSQIFDTTLQFDAATPLTLTVVKQPTNTQYGITVSNFKIKLNVVSQNDVTVSGSVIPQAVATNRLGFVEQFIPSSYGVSNIIDSDDTTFWKSSPQPVSDAVVSFVVALVDPIANPTGTVSVNRMYLDPLYTDTVFNLYYSYNANYWYPVQRDFRLRKGIYELPTINARYLKFEFTQLTAEPYQLTNNSVEKIVKVFPTWVDDYFINLEHAIPNIANQTYDQSSAVTPDTNYVSTINTQTIYGGAVDNLSMGWSAGATLPGVNYSSSITEPTVSYKTVLNQGTKGAVFNPLTDTRLIIRRFPYAGTHEYKNVNITQTWNHAYFTGLKNLLLFNNNYSVQIDYPEFTDYLLSSGTNSIIASGTAVFNPVSWTSASGVTGGGYTGSVGSTLYTRPLNTMTQYNGFKIAALNTDWQVFLTPAQTTLQSSSLAALSINATNCTGSVLTNGNGYNIFQITATAATSSLESAQAGSTNLLTTDEAKFVLTSGWTTITGATTVTYSGVTPVYLNNNATSPWNSALGNFPMGGSTFGSPTQVVAANNGSYTFLFAASGTSSSVIPVVSYSGANGITTFSGSQTTLTGSQQISYTTQQPTNTTRVDFRIVTSGAPVLSSGGYFLGTSAVYTNPLRTLGMRLSATARIFLPQTSFGTYRVSLIGYTTTGTSVELANRQFTRLPVQTWMDLEVPFTLTNASTTYGSFTVKVTQTTSTAELYQIALFGIFYNPLTFEYTTSSGSQWNYVVNGVNDPDATVAFNANSNQVQFRATFLQDNSTLSALSIIPNYTQSPLYSTTPIQYIGDSKTNEISWRRSPNQRPLFQLPHQLHPAGYDIAVMMGIFNSYYPT